MSYEQLMESVGNLAVVNANLKTAVQGVQVAAEAARDSAEAFAVSALAASSEVSGKLLEAEVLADNVATARVNALKEPDGANDLSVQLPGAPFAANLALRFGRRRNLIDDFGAIPGNAAACTKAFFDALAYRGEIDIPSEVYRIDYQALAALSPSLSLNVLNNTFLDGAKGAVIEIMSNKLPDGTRIELIGKDIELANLTLKEVNAVLGRDSFYGTLSGNGCVDYVLRNITVDGANGAGFHFRNGCKNMRADVIRALNTKSDGFHVQRGCTGGVITDFRGVGNEDDCLAFVSHGRNSGWGPVSGFKVFGAYGGPQANSTVGSALAIIGGQDISVFGLVGVDNGLSTVRILPWKSALEGDYGCKDIYIPNLVSRGAGKTTSQVAGVVRDGITVGGGININLPDADITGAAGNNVSIVESGIDVKITQLHGKSAAGRGMWCAAILQPITGGSAVGYLAELVANDPRYVGATHVGFDYSVFDNIVTECSGTDGLYLDGSATPAIRWPRWNDLKSYKPNMLDQASKYSVFIRGTVGMELDGVVDELSTGTNPAASLTFSNADYTRITNLSKAQISTTYPSHTTGDRREFYATAAPATAAQPAVGPIYKFGDRIVNPGAGTDGWIYKGSGTGWVVK